MVRDEDLDGIQSELAANFEHLLRRLPPLPDPVAAFDPARRQYNSALILRALVESCPPEAHRLVAVTERDLFIPMLSFVFGQAQLGGKVALVSFARLRQEFYGLPSARAVFAARARKEVLHEIGHTFGLTHCPTRACPMSLATGIAQVDEKGQSFCGPCAAQLRASGVPLIQTEKLA